MALALALVLDALFGEPPALWHRLPHPVVLAGRAVDGLDRALNKGTRRRLRGLVALVLLCAGALFVGWAISLIPTRIPDVAIAAVLLAQRSLVDHLSEVASSLRASVAKGRASVALIVGRDTSELDRAAVARAAVESGAENFSDGVIGPGFWFLLGGLPGIMLYKVVNTADSMIGHRNETYREFGWAAAKLDDLLNLVPARLTALLLWFAAPRHLGIRGFLADARSHRSPNAGWPEAAMARALRVALSGPRLYGGVRSSERWVNEGAERDLTGAHILHAIALLWRAWLLALVLSIALGFALQI